MTGKERDDKPKSERLDKEAKRLWAHVTKGVEPFDTALPLEMSEIPEPVISKPKPAIPPPKSTIQKEPQGFEMDRRNEMRFRKGQMEIDGILDLHGLSVARAQERLTSFILQSYAAKKRCLLVITGKGAGKANAEISSHEYKGVIRSSFKLWLEDARLKHLVLSVAQAKPQHGGAGAFYVLLRRQR